MNKQNSIVNFLDILEEDIALLQLDEAGDILYASKAFLELSLYTLDELIGKNITFLLKDKNIVTDLRNYFSKKLQQSLALDTEFIKKDSSSYWVDLKVKYKDLTYICIIQDITQKKEAQSLNQKLEELLIEQSIELTKEKETVEEVIANILFPILITSRKRRVIVYANKYAQELYEASEDEIIEAKIDDIYTLDNGPQHIIEAIEKYGRVDVIEEVVTTHTGKKFVGLLSVIPITYKGEDCFIGMTVDITKQKNMEREIREIHEQTKKSIEYASLIQHSLIPKDNLFSKYFKDSFVVWQPKDTVGGDIYLFEELRDNNECLLLVIDCTGHGVPGAFVTMIVKAIEREIVSYIKENKDLEISTSWILQYFNTTIKKLLDQNSLDSQSNVGFDGAVIYYNKKDKIIKFSGANTPLFYLKSDKLEVIKPDRYSVGYKKCDIGYEYKEHILNIQSGMKFYISTDGFFDQNGGKKGFPMGKRAFKELILNNYKLDMKKQKVNFINSLEDYMKSGNISERNDDITLIGIEI